MNRYPSSPIELHQEIKKSRFIAHVIPSNCTTTFDTYRDQLLAQHAKASHIGYAWRRASADAVIEGFSDDGEPKGTVGLPLLKLIQQRQLINTAVLVVRYFGGIKLGTGGLMRGYTSTAAAAISAAEQQNLLDIFQRLNQITIIAPFASEQMIRRFCQQLSIEQISVTYSEGGLRAIIVADAEKLTLLKSNFSFDQQVNIEVDKL